MKPKRIILIRHGQSQGNVDKEIYKYIPDYAIQLTPTGRDQAYEAGLKLKEIVGNETVKFYISPFWRTRQTFQQIRKQFTIAPFYEDPRLREQDWTGKLPIDGYRNADEMERDSYGHFYYRFSNGESCADDYDRVSGVLDTIWRDFEKKDFPDNCIIVGHGMTNRVILMRWFHLSVEEFEIIANPKNCEMYVLELQPNGKYKLTTELKKYPAYKHKYQFDWSLEEQPIQYKLTWWQKMLGDWVRWWREYD